MVLMCSGVLSLHLLPLQGWMILRWGLSCALCSVWNIPRSPPPGCQKNGPPRLPQPRRFPGTGRLNRSPVLVRSSGTDAATMRQASCSWGICPHCQRTPSESLRGHAWCWAPTAGHAGLRNHPRPPASGFSSAQPWELKNRSL